MTEELPALAALKTDAHRVFCEEYVEHQNGMKSYMMAFPECSRASAPVLASRLLKRADIKAAIIELSGHALIDNVPRAVAAITAILEDPFHKDRGRIAEKIVERQWPSVSKQEITVTKTDATDAAMMERIAVRVLASGGGIDQLRAMFGSNTAGLEQVVTAARDKMKLIELKPNPEFNPEEQF